MTVMTKKRQEYNTGLALLASYKKQVERKIKEYK